MTNKVIHVSEEIHEKISEYCRNNGLFMTEWLEYLILKEIIGEAKTPVKRKKLKKLDNTKQDSVYTSLPFWANEK